MVLSIIIPVYNVERYIDGTLNSIYTNCLDLSMFEVVVVNDGTPDNSMQIVDRYKKKYCNLNIINQPNSGLSVARNTGIIKSKGKYVWFVDSDDTINSQSFRYILELLSSLEVDIVGFNVNKIAELDGNVVTSTPFVCSSPYQLYDSVLDKEQCIGNLHIGLVQRYILKRSFLIANSLQFLPKIWYEDDQLMLRAIIKADLIYVSSAYSYNYLVRNTGSIMSTKTIKCVIDSESIIDSWKSFVSKGELSAPEKQWVYYNISKYFSYILSLRQANIHGYNEYMCSKRINYKKQMLWYGILASKYIGIKKYMKLLVLFFSESLFNKYFSVQ